MPSKLSKLLMDDSFVRYLKGEATKEEETRWTEWMKENDPHGRLIEKGRNLLESGVLTLPKPDPDVEFKLLMNRIEGNNKSSFFNSSHNRGRNLVWATIAASMCLLLLIGFLTRNTFFQDDEPQLTQMIEIDYQTLETETGQKTTIQYSDGSKITLNANSKIRLPRRMVESDTLQVWLEGEAFFDITRKDESKSRNFIVHTPDGSVSVLGTRFTVNTTRNQSQVVLTEGSVKVSVQKTDNEPISEYIMSPGEKALFSKNLENISVERVNTEVYTSWTGNSLVLDKTPLSVLIDRMEFTYDVEVRVEDESLLDKELTGRFNNTDLNFLLTGLSKMLEVDIDQQKQTVYIKEN